MATARVLTLPAPPENSPGTRKGANPNARNGPISEGGNAVTDDPRSGQWVAIGDLDVSEIAQSVQLPCYCTVTFTKGGEPALAKVVFTSITRHCDTHTFADIGQCRFIGLTTRVWAAPDALLVSSGSRRDGL